MAKRLTPMSKRGSEYAILQIVTRGLAILASGCRDVHTFFTNVTHYHHLITRRSFMATKIAIVNEKGGVGKTATATTLAYLLSKHGYKTLLIDFDGQAHSSLINGINPNTVKISVSTLMNCVIDGSPLPDVDKFIHKNENGVHIIPANSELFRMERVLCNVNFREGKLNELISHFEHLYEYIIIDCMPQMGTPMVNVLMCADELIIPTQTELLSVQGLGALINHIKQIKRMNHRLSIGGILITMNDKKTTLSSHMIDSISISFGNEIKIFNTRIPRSIKVAEACLYFKTICEYLPKNPAALAYEDFYFEWMENKDTPSEGGV
jgi:chromosome partitioning protein